MFVQTVFYQASFFIEQNNEFFNSLLDPILDLFDWSRIICRAESIMKQIALAITSIEENNEIPSNQTTNKTRASADTSENQGSSEGTRRTEGRRSAFENQE